MPKKGESITYINLVTIQYFEDFEILMMTMEEVENPGNGHRYESRVWSFGQYLTCAIYTKISGVPR